MFAFRLDKCLRINKSSKWETWKNASLVCFVDEISPIISKGQRKSYKTDDDDDDFLWWWNSHETCLSTLTALIALFILILNLNCFYLINRASSKQNRKVRPRRWSGSLHIGPGARRVVGVRQEHLQLHRMHAWVARENSPQSYAQHSTVHEWNEELSREAWRKGFRRGGRQSPSIAKARRIPQLGSDLGGRDASIGRAATEGISLRTLRGLLRIARRHWAHHQQHEIRGEQRPDGIWR